MPELRLTCLSAAVKELVAKELHHITDQATRDIFGKIVTVVADCPAGQQVGVELIDHPVAQGAKKKRAPSEYNNFMGQCARSREKGGQGKDFKTCAAEYKRTHPKKTR